MFILTKVFCFFLNKIVDLVVWIIILFLVLLTIYYSLLRFIDLEAHSFTARIYLQQPT